VIIGVDLDFHNVAFTAWPGRLGGRGLYGPGEGLGGPGRRRGAAGRLGLGLGLAGIIFSKISCHRPWSTRPGTTSTSIR
jgi:hypothetical protein